MKLTILLLSFIAISCSSGEKKMNKEAPSDVTDQSFKKEKPLKNSEVSDFYAGNKESLNPALQDETLDRYSAEELASISESSDPLMEISLRCSRGDFDRAFAKASESFQKYQKVASYWNLVANCHLNQGSHRKALLFYNKALEVSPNYVPVLNNIGVMYSRQNQDQKALVAFERANKQSKFSKTPRYNLAKLYLRYGLAEEALPIFKGLLSGSPEDADLLNAVASTYFLMSDYQAALSHFQRIPKNEWVRAEIGLNFAITLKKVGQSKEASALLNDVEKPKSPELKRYYAVVTKAVGE